MKNILLCVALRFNYLDEYFVREGSKLPEFLINSYLIKILFIIWDRVYLKK